MAGTDTHVLKARQNHHHHHHHHHSVAILAQVSDISTLQAGSFSRDLLDSSCARYGMPNLMCEFLNISMDEITGPPSVQLSLFCLSRSPCWGDVDGMELFYTMNGASPFFVKFDVIVVVALAALLFGLWVLVNFPAGLAGLLYLLRSGKGKTHLSRVPWPKKSEDTKTLLWNVSSPSSFQVNMASMHCWTGASSTSPSIVDGRGTVVLAAASEAEAVLHVSAAAAAAAGMQHALKYLLTLVGNFVVFWHIVCVSVFGFSVRRYGHLVGMATTTEGETGRSPSRAGSVTAAAGAAAAASCHRPRFYWGK